MFWLLLLVLLVILLGSSGVIYPANYAEIQLSEATEKFRSALEITEDMIPPGCTYGVYRADGSWLYGTFPEEERESAWRHYQEAHIYAHGNRVYRFFYRDTGEVCIVNYELTVQYRNAFLRKYFPGIEGALILLYVFLFLAHTVMVSRSFGKYMKKRLSILNEATEKIRSRNLEFEPQHSEIREVEELLDSLYQMKETLRESLYRQWDLEKNREEQIAALAHDIRTPLTVIRGNAELLAEGELAEEEKEYNRDILQSVAIMEEYLRMLHEILQEDRVGAENVGEQEGAGERKNLCEESAWMERGAGEIREEERNNLCEEPAGEAEDWKNGCGEPAVEAGNRKSRCEEPAGEAGNRQISCEELAGKMEEQARLLASARQCAVVFRRDELDGLVRGNEIRMIRAFQNIVSNALDYSPAGKGIRIDFSSRGEEGEAYLSAKVMDEGPGFSAEDLKYAAERFYRGDKSRSSQEHYGIGLHTARRFAENQGGYLVIANGEEGGAEVTLYIRKLEKRTKTDGILIEKRTETDEILKEKRTE